MKQAIKTYNLYHSIWDKLIFGLLVPIVIIIVHVVITLGLKEAVFAITVLYTMMAEIIRDYFTFNGAYCKETHNTILRSAFWGKKLFLKGIMQEHARNLAHYVILIGICSCITAYINEYDPYYIPIKVIIVLIAYSMNTLAVNVLRYFDYFAIYPLISTPFVIIAAIPISLLITTGIRLSAGLVILFVILALTLAVIVTILSYLHASLCYDKSFVDISSKRSRRKN
jgi:hypothetical protein